MTTLPPSSTAATTTSPPTDRPAWRDRRWSNVDRAAVAIALAATALAVVALYTAIALWPAADRSAEIARLTQSGKPVAGLVVPKTHWFGIDWRSDQSSTLLLLAVVFGALGAAVNGAWNLSVRVGNRSVSRGWLLWNALVPVLGTCLAVLVHLTFDAKLFGLGYNDATLRPATVAVISAAAGMSATSVRRFMSGRLSRRLEEGEHHRDDDHAVSTASSGATNSPTTTTTSGSSDRATSDTPVATTIDLRADTPSTPQQPEPETKPASSLS